MNYNDITNNDSIASSKDHTLAACLPHRSPRGRSAVAG